VLGLKPTRFPLRIPAGYFSAGLSLGGDPSPEKGETMRIIRSFALVLAVFLIASLPAAAKNSRTIKVLYSASLTGTPVAAGEYAVSWVSHSPEATVTLAKGNKSVATAEGKWVERASKYEKNGVVYSTHSDGTRSIDEIRFAGMSQVIVFGESGSSGGQ
jgi:hypothetical protein